jgi:hypothetical protein
LTRSPIELARLVEHLGGHVDRVHVRGLLGEHAGEPADAAADVEHDVAGLHARADGVEHGLEVAASLRPEPVDVGVAIRPGVVDEVERVLAGTRVPEAPHVPRAHGGHPSSLERR